MAASDDPTGSDWRDSEIDLIVADYFDMLRLECAANRLLGKRGEERVLFSERSRLRVEGRNDLASKVRWVSEEDCDGAGYDILSFDTAGSERLLEVKTTVGSDMTPFLFDGERAVAFRRAAGRISASPPP